MRIKREETYLLFKEIPLLQGERVGFGNDRHDVDHLAEASHELHVQGPQTGHRQEKYKDRSKMSHNRPAGGSSSTKSHASLQR